MSRLTILQTANSVSADYDKIAEFFEELDRYLKRLKILETYVPPIPELRHTIAGILTSVLVLCGIFAKYIRKNRIGEYIAPKLFTCPDFISSAVLTSQCRSMLANSIIFSESFSKSYIGRG